MDDLITSIDSLQFNGVLLQLIPAFLLLISIVLWWQPLRRIRNYQRLQKLIRNAGVQCLRDVYVPGGVDGQIYIEYLLLLPDRMLLLHVKPYYGNIFAGEQIEYWTQVIGHRSFKFANPLHQLQVTLGELRGQLPKIMLDGKVLFTTGSRFPKGKPEKILEMSDIKEMANGRAVPAEIISNAWQALSDMAKPANQISVKLYLRRHDRRRLLYGAVLLLLALILVGAQFISH